MFVFWYLGVVLACVIVIPFYLAGNLLLWVFYVEEVACEDEDDDDDNANIWVLLLHLLQCFVQSFSSFSESSISSKALVILLLLLPSFLSPLEFSPADSRNRTPQLPQFSLLRFDGDDDGGGLRPLEAAAFRGLC